jgi:hypothetical protein
MCCNGLESTPAVTNGRMSIRVKEGISSARFIHFELSSYCYTSCYIFLSLTIKGNGFRQGFRV